MEIGLAFSKNPFYRNFSTRIKKRMSSKNLSISIFDIRNNRKIKIDRTCDRQLFIISKNEWLKL